jgi:deoxyribodipyrimidine photolyase
MNNLHIYWSRRDFRVHDNKALAGAVAASLKESGQFLPLFVLENYMIRAASDSQFGYPSRHMIAHAVPRFAEHFTQFVVLNGRGAESLISVVRLLARDFETITIHVNEDVYSDFYKQVARMKAAGVTIQIYQDRLTVPHDTVTGQGNVYSVFTPFRNAVWSGFVNAVVAKKPNLDAVEYLSAQYSSKIQHTIECTTDAIWGACSHQRTMLAGDVEYNLDDVLDAIPDLSSWYIDEVGAHKHFTGFLKNSLGNYSDRRDGLGVDGTSHMSVALAWGLVSARMLVSAITKHFQSDFANPYSTGDNIGAIQYISELIWREFYAYLLFHNPALMHVEFQQKFRNTIHWKGNAHAHGYFIAWMKGETGYPVVDAAMKEIQMTGVMHNRSRMIVSSFLTKHLGVNWRWGQEYFRAMLIDIDECSNNGGWQWGASVGADPKPIRIFNPTLQADKYDKDFAYRKKWLGESFDPKSYRAPIVDHKQARNNALFRYALNSTEIDIARDF